jgi:formylglycine-generating enzyme required for sulfatase activity/GH43 family beta-xylosidase
MKHIHIWIFATILAAVCLAAAVSSQAEPLVTQDYWILTDGYRGEFTNGGQMTMTYGAYPPNITGDVFDVDWPGSTGTTDQFFNYDGGRLVYYGAKFVDSSEWMYVPDTPQPFLPAVVQTGGTYTCAWSRKEYQNGLPKGYGSDSYTITVNGPFTTTVPAGAYTTYEFKLINNWQTSSGGSGTTVYTYYLAKGIGWVKLIRDGVTYDLISAPFTRPTVTTAAVTNISTTSATSGGNVTSDGGTPVTARGVCWSTSANPTTSNSKTTNGSGTGSFTSSLTGLSPSTTYHVRAYATNSVGTSYGSDINFVTSAPEIPPTVKTHYPSNVTRTSATLNAEVNPNGLDTTWHFEYGTSDACDSSTPNQSGGSGSARQPVSRSLTGLTPDTTYYYRIAAENDKGESLGGIQTLRTSVLYVEPYGACGGHTPCYSSIQHAAEAAVYGGTLKIANDDYYEDLEPGTWGNLYLEGGWNASFSSRSPISATSSTVMNGTLLIGADMEGAVLVNGLVLGGESAPTKPTVTTTAVTNITTTGATSGGNVTSDGGASVTARGVCWSTSANPTTSNSKTTNGTGTGSFTSSINGLNASTTYHVRAYATNSLGTSYGSDITFKSASPNQPVVSTGSASGVSTNSATLNGTVNPKGLSTTYYFQYGTSTSYGTNTASTSVGSGTSAVSVSTAISGLTSGVTYHFRLTATSSAGTSYGSDQTFVTAANSPTVSTTAVAGITAYTATSGGNVTSDGGASVTARGVCWSTSANPTTSNSKTTNGSGTGSFTSSITGLNSNTTYHVRAYATNIVGTSYGSDVSFKTPASQPTVTTTAVSGITPTTATSGGNVTSDGGSSVTARGVCWSTSANPTTSNSKTTNGSGTGSFTSSLTGLSPATTYHVRAYATNSVGTNYGADVSFKTPASQPTVTTTAVSGITATTATSGGNVTSDGGGSVTARGVCWSTSANPTTSNNKTTDGSGAGSFASSIAGLSSKTSYHVRAYATNSVGTSYGDDVSFTTSAAQKPTVTTGSASAVATSSATLNGIVNPNGSNTTYYFQYGTTTGYGSSTTSTSAGSGSSSVSVSASLTGLTNGTTYHYRLVATNSAGTSYGSDKTFTTPFNTLGMYFVRIPAGTFTMGSPSDELGRFNHEGPQHQVTLTQSFYMQSTEVTQAQWEAVMGSNPSYFKDCGTCPVEQVSWDDVQEFIGKMNQRGEGTYSLPTEAQWEYAARAGSTTAFYNGGITVTDNSYDPNLDKIGWYGYNSSDKTHPVAQKTPNAWGLYDMSGNVYEWCQDWYGSYPSGAVTDPTGPSSGSEKVSRGGHWVNGAVRCRSAFRESSYHPAYGNWVTGCRLLRQP